jgi:hypothetical protein
VIYHFSKPTGRANASPEMEQNLPKAKVASR